MREFSEDLEKKMTKIMDDMSKTFSHPKEFPETYHLQIFGSKDQLIEIMNFWEKIRKRDKGEIH